jgi:hypothetical protein
MMQGSDRPPVGLHMGGAAAEPQVSGRAVPGVTHARLHRWVRAQVSKRIIVSVMICGPYDASGFSEAMWEQRFT